MMKSIFFFFVFLVLFSGFVSSGAVEVDFVKDSYFSGETVQAEVIVDSVESLRSNMIKLYQNDSPITASFNLVKLNSSFHYLYFDLRNNLVGNYDLVFEDVIFTENGSTHQSDFVFPLIVEDTNNSIFYMNPGFVKADDLQFNNLFYVYLLNRGSENINILLSSEYDFIDLSTDVVPLSSNDAEYFTIYLSDFLVDGETGMKYVDLSSGSFGYSLPVWLGFGEETVEVEDGGVYFVENSDFFDVTVDEGDTLEGGYIRFENSLDYATDVQFTLTGNLEDVVELEFESIEDVEPQETITLGLTVHGIEAGYYEGEILSYAGPPYEDNFLIKVTVLDVEGEVVVNGTVEDGGNNVVDPNSTNGTSEEDEEGFKLGVWFWILVFVVLIGLFLYRRYKKKKVKKPHPFFQK